MLIPEPVEAVLNFPWHVTKGLVHASFWPVRALMNTPDMPTTIKPQDGESVYDIAQPMLIGCHLPLEIQSGDFGESQGAQHIVHCSEVNCSAQYPMVDDAYPEVVGRQGIGVAHFFL